MAPRGRKSGKARGRSRVRAEVQIDEERGVFMISVAAELADMHPQTLRMYEARGLIAPKRSPKNTRLYSQADVERLRRIQRMTSEEGLNLAGVESVLELERRVEKMRGELTRMSEELEKLRKSGGELVPYRAYESEELGSGKRSRSQKIRVRRRSR